jgi:hypothetical protein
VLPFAEKNLIRFNLHEIDVPHRDKEFLRSEAFKKWEALEKIGNGLCDLILWQRFEFFHGSTPQQRK